MGVLVRMLEREGVGGVGGGGGEGGGNIASRGESQGEKSRGGEGDGG